MPIRHRLTDADTLVSLSLLYFGIEDRVMDIVDYNKLVHPYISTENKDKYMVYAHGYIYVERDVATQTLTIRKNWTFKTRPSIINAVSKTYKVVEDTVIPAGVSSAYIPVRSAIPGLQGNALEGTVSVLGEEFIKNFVSFKKVRNDEPIRGGTEGKVLTTGDYIYIPSEDADLTLDSTDAGYNQARYYYGEDFLLTDDDLTVSTTGDIATIGFGDNVIQAVIQRLKAERGDNPSDFNFGTDIPTLIGNAQIPKDILPKRIIIEILQTLEFEDRIHSPEVVDIRIVPQEQSVYIDLDMKIISLEEVLQIRGLRIGG